MTRAAPAQINVLISLYPGYGLGDAIQMSAVLRHVARYRSHWRVHYLAEEGKHQIARGLVDDHFGYGRNYPDVNYDAEVQVRLYDTWANWRDRPNTRVSSTLHEQFGLGWDPACGGYSCEVRPDSQRAARALLYGCGQDLTSDRDSRKYWSSARFVAVHYQGDSSSDRKDLSHDQAGAICREIERLGCTPVVLDWRCRSPLPYRKVRSPSSWGGDAEMVCAVIEQCAAFVGIDSGPAKAAAATPTPALVCWHGHHPAPFFDPSPRVTHAVPAGYHGLYPVCEDRAVVDWFEAHYNVRQYRGDPVVAIKAWLAETLA